MDREDRLSLPPISRYLLEHVSPARRRQIAAWNLDLSIYLTPPAVWATLTWPIAGVVILIIVSFYAITITGFDSLATTDVRAKQEAE